MRNRLRRVSRINPRLSATAVSGGTSGRPRPIRGPPMTEAGMCFLKCAFAPPDFTNTGVRGVPDSFRGESLIKKHSFTTSLSVSSGTDYYILILPVPGITMFMATVTAGSPVIASSQFMGTNYPDFTSLFGTGVNTPADNATAFRFISNHFELVSTTNEMTWSGMISAWKVPIQVENRASQATTLNDLITITGINGVNAPQAKMYSGTSKEGVYLGCYNDSTDFEFSPIREGFASLPAAFAPEDFGELVSSNSIPGYDNSFQAAVVKISGLSGANTFIMRHWACVEYKISPQSVLYEYQGTSPPEDKLALRAYKEVILGIPLAVPANQNANFWSRVLSILRTVTGVGAMLPGPYGMISGGLNAITGAMTELFI